MPPESTADSVLSTNREPVVLTVVATSADATVFPADAVALVGRPPGGAVLAVLLGLVAGLGIAGMATGPQVAERWGLPVAALAIGGMAVFGSPA